MVFLMVARNLRLHPRPLESHICGQNSCLQGRREREGEVSGELSVRRARKWGGLAHLHARISGHAFTDRRNFHKASQDAPDESPQLRFDIQWREKEKGTTDSVHFGASSPKMNGRVG